MDAVPFDDAPLGATPAPGGGFRFRVWAPRASRVEVAFPGRPRRRIVLEAGPRGYYAGQDPEGRDGDRYWIRLDGRRFPDPTSRSQPDGGAGPSALVDPSSGPARVDLDGALDARRTVLYELHVGTFSPEGTFDGAIARLPGLAELGVTAVELMPVPEGGGERGWGYGGVHQFAVRRAYGGPAGLRRFVNATHRSGLGVVLDVVYNHWGGDAKFLESFGPYFDPRATTPWGPTPNVAGAGGDEVRRYFVENVRWWLEECGIDGFRFDAVHEVVDRGTRPFWGTISDAAHASGDRLRHRPLLIAESDLNDVRILRPTGEGGWGIDAQWSDDFHHALHVAVTGETRGYYSDYAAAGALARALERPFLFEGQYSEHRQRSYGAPAGSTPSDRFVVFDQNHDQVGNRGDGARLVSLVGPELARVALAITVFSPYVPMLFMGEEYGERRPFYFFGDPPLRARARLAEGRRRQLLANGFAEAPPDPSDPATLEASRLDWTRATTPEGVASRAFLTELLRLRRTRPALRPGGTVRAVSQERWIAFLREAEGDRVAVLANLGSDPVPLPGLGWAGSWRELFRSDPGATAGWAGAAGISLAAVPVGPPLPARSLVALTAGPA